MSARTCSLTCVPSISALFSCRFHRLRKAGAHLDCRRGRALERREEGRPMLLDVLLEHKACCVKIPQHHSVSFGPVAGAESRRGLIWRSGMLAFCSVTTRARFRQVSAWTSRRSCQLALAGFCKCRIGRTRVERELGDEQLGRDAGRLVRVERRLERSHELVHRCPSAVRVRARPGVVQ